MSTLDIDNACSTSSNEPVGTTSLAAASCNLGYLDKLVNSTDSTVTNRVGSSSPTISERNITLNSFEADALQRVNAIGVIFDSPIRDWSASLLISDLRAHRYPPVSGDIYIPTSPLPFTTGASFNADDWELLQGVTEGDIINNTSQDYIFTTSDSYKAFTSSLPIGKAVRLLDREANFTVISGNTSGNDADIIASSQVNQSLDLSEKGNIPITSLGVLPASSGTIPESIVVSGLIVAVMNAYVSSKGVATFLINRGIYFDARSLFDNIPAGCQVIVEGDDTGYSYVGYRSKGEVYAAHDIQDIDSRQLIQSGHHPTISLFNSQLSNTGIGGVGQSGSSTDGRCSITFQAGYDTVNGRDIPAPSSRIQRFQTNGIGDIHMALQMPTETGVGTRTLFDFTSSGNASFGGASVRDEYNFLLYPRTANTPAGNEITAIALRQDNPTSGGCLIEMASRDAAATSSMAVKYLDGELTFLASDTLDGDHDGRLEQVVFEADMTIGQGRSTPSGNNSNIKTVATTNKSSVNTLNTLPSGLTATQLLIDTRSSTEGFDYIRFVGSSSVQKFSVNGGGNMELSGTVSPGGTQVKWTSGTGTPEGVLTAAVGSMYTRTDGGAGTTLYIKESGTSSTGWVAK